MEPLEDHLSVFIKALAGVPDSQLDKKLAQECGDFKDGDDPIRFLRDLRDKAVRYDAASAFTLQAISAYLSNHPETDQEAAERRRHLLAAERGVPVENVSIEELLPPKPEPRGVVERRGEWAFDGKYWYRDYGTFHMEILSVGEKWSAMGPWAYGALLPEGVMRGPFDTLDEAVKVSDEWAAERSVD